MAASTVSALQTCPTAARSAGASRRAPAAAAAQPARAASHAGSRVLAARQAFGSVAAGCQALLEGPSMRRRVLGQARPRGAVVVAASSSSSAFHTFSDITTNLFPVWTVIAALIGLYNPALFAAIDTKYFTAMLAALSASPRARG